MTYAHNCCGSNDTGDHDEGGTGEEGHERNFALHADVDGPEERKWDRKKVHVCDDIENHGKENIDAGDSWLTEI